MNGSIEGSRIGNAERSDGLGRWTIRLCGRVLLLLAVAGGLALAWAFVEPRVLLDVDRVEVRMAALPAELDGVRIAHLSDPQVGIALHNLGTFRKAVRRTVRERPDLVLLGGDYIYRAGVTSGPELRRLTGILEPLARAGLPVLAVLGNHDWGATAEGPARPDSARGLRVRRALEALGIRVLENEAVAVRLRGGARLWVVGIGSRDAGHARPDRAMRGVPARAARVALMHNPLTFRRLPAGSAPLALAGHTHGGQVRIPFTPGWNWLTMSEHVPARAVAEWAAPGFGRSGNRLYVNRGIGFSGLPVRFNCPPHLPIFTLRRGG